MPRHTSSEGYKTGATAYVSGRPGYPPEALDWLRDVVRVGPGRNVLELGAGTGISLCPCSGNAGERSRPLSPLMPCARN